MKGWKKYENEKSSQSDRCSFFIICFSSPGVCVYAVTGTASSVDGVSDSGSSATSDPTVDSSDDQDFMEDIDWFDYPDIINAPDDLELIEEEEIEDSGDGNGTRLTNSELDIITARVAESLIVPLQSFTQQASSGISPLVSSTQYAFLNGRINTAFSRISSNDSKIASAVGNINSTRNTVNSVNSTVKSHTTNISTLKGNVQKLMTWQSSANSKLNQLTGIKSDISTLKSWRTSHTSAFNSLKSTVTSQGNRLNTVETWKAGANSTISSHTSRLNTLESWRKTHDTWAGTQKGRIDSLDSWKSTISGTVSNLTTRMGSIESWKTSFVNSQNTLNTTQTTRIADLEKQVNSQIIDKANPNNLLTTGLYVVKQVEGELPDGRNAWAYIQVKKMAGAVEQLYISDTNPNLVYRRVKGGSQSSFSKWTKNPTELDLSELQKKDIELANLIKKETENRTKDISSVTEKIGSINQSITALKAFEGAQTIWNVNQSKRITDLEKQVNSQMIDKANPNELLTTGLYVIKEVEGELPDGRNAWAYIQVKKMAGAVEQLYISDVNPQTVYRRVKGGSQSSFSKWAKNPSESDLTALQKKDIELTNLIKQETEERKSSDKATALSVLSINQQLSDINNRIDNLSFNDTGIIAAILASIKANDDLWNADSYDGASVGANDGKAVRLFKNQFQGLKTHYAGIMKYYFDMNDPNSAIYRLRYSIVAGFGETGELLEEWFTTLLESQNTTNSYLGTIADWLEMQNGHLKKCYEALCIITDWLKLIYEKPPQTVNVTIPPLELDENGNGWLKTLIKTVGDVMKTAIETLGRLLETAIGEIGQLLRDLLAFLDGLIDDIIGLVVPENLDFMHKKFDSTGNAIKLKFPFIFGWVDSFKGLFGNQTKLEDQPFSLNGMFEGEVKLPFSVLNDFAPVIRGFATGFVLLGFLIDMYHWFHTRGEVIE